jgi:hypothetical protein
MSLGDIDLDLAVADSHSRHNLSEGNADYSKILNACSQRMYHDFSWSISMPKVPASPMLFRPDVLKDVFAAGTTVMNSEVDAMKFGVLDAIPLMYYPVAPGEIRKAFDVAASSSTAGSQLDEKDRQLLDTDIDVDLLDKRALPSLTLLKRPLYTEIGLSSVEERHQERLARLIPPHLLSLVGNTQEGLELRRSMSHNNGAFIGNNGSSQSPLTPGGAHFQDPVAQRQSKGVNQSFKFAKSVDVTFNQLMAGIRVQKLGLGGALSELESSQITRQFWEALFFNTSGAQQRRVWVAVCRYVRQTLGAADDVAPVDLINEISKARLQNESSFWLQWTKQFQRALAEVDVALSKSLLSMDVLDYTIPVDREQNVFKAGISVANPLNRTSSRIIDPADNRSRLATFPVSIRPILPSGYTEVVDLLLRGEDAYSPLVQGALASRSESLSQLVVQGVREALPRRTQQQACAEPHILVNGSLLIADEVSTSGSPVVAPDMTLASHTSGNLVFEEYLSTDADTSALLMELHPKVCLYDRISSRKEFRRNAAAVAPICEQYVICFDGIEGSTPGDAEVEGSAKKRQREE